MILRLAGPLRRAWIVGLAAVAGCGAGDGDDRPARVELVVSAAVSLREAMTDLAREYEAEHPGVRVHLNFGASGMLQQQVEQGAGVDVFVSAAERQVDALEAAGLVVPGSRRALASNRLVLVAPAGPGVEGFADLAAPAVERIAIGAPESVPAGAYARETLRHLGLWDDVAGRTVYAANVRQVLTYVERGEVDAGLVYATDARGSDAVRVVATAPPGSHRPIVYPMAVVVGSAHPAEAAAYLDFLASPAAHRVLRRHGFSPPRAR